MRRPSRPLITVAAAAALSVFGGSMGATAQVVTIPGASTTVAPATTTTVASTTTVAPATTVAPPTTAPETKIILLPPPDATKVTDPSRPASASTLTPTPTPATGAATTVPGSTSTLPPSLSAGQVDAVLRDQQRSGASSTTALVEALRPLQTLGMTAQEALALGMGQFPVLGVANWTDDWLDPRSGPPPHQHQGTDVFSAFDTPVRAPVDGKVTFADAGLGGKGAIVTAPDGTYYYMAHLNSFSRELSNGAAVKQGQVVGSNGDSGNAQGGAPHVHFEVHPLGGAAVNPKPYLDGWVSAALARVPALLASFQPAVAGGVDTPPDDFGVPQILVATGLTRRFSSPSQPALIRDRPPSDFNRAVLGPLTPTALAPLLDPTQADK